MTMLEDWRKTSDDKPGAALRMVSGLAFLMAGILKITVPSLGAAFSGQLLAASIPFPELVKFSFPIIEAAIGILLLVGLHARLSALVATISMVIATYVHIVVEDPSLFPLQPVEPIGPLVLIAILLYTVFRGAGAWSIDLRESLRS